MGRQMQQNAVDFLLHSLEIYGALYLFYIALWSERERAVAAAIAFQLFLLQNINKNLAELVVGGHLVHCRKGRIVGRFDSDLKAEFVAILGLYGFRIFR